MWYRGVREAAERRHPASLMGGVGEDGKEGLGNNNNRSMVDENRKVVTGRAAKYEAD